MDSAHAGYYLEFGIGANTLALGTSRGTSTESDGFFGNSIFLNACYRDRGSLYTLLLTHHESEFELFEQPDVEVTDIGVMYGASHIRNWMYWSYSGGASVVIRGERGALNPNAGMFAPTYLTVNHYGAGVIGEMEAGVTFYHYISFGLSLFGSLNTLKSYLSCALVFQLGYL